MKRLFWLPLCAAALSLSLSSCQVVTMATGAYGAATTYKTLGETQRLQEALREAKPVFLGYDSVIVEAKVKPREEGKAAQVIATFKDNLNYLVQQNAGLVGSGLKVCQSPPCEGKTLVVSFREEGYDADVVEKLTLGSGLKGTVYFVDQPSGDVLQQAPLVLGKDYAQLLAQFHTYLGAGVIKSEAKRLGESGEDQDEISEQINGLIQRHGQIPAVKPGYQELMSAS